MKKSAVIAIVCLSLANLAGAAGIFGVGGVYTENFDSIGPGGTTPPPDWITGDYTPYQNRKLLDAVPGAVQNDSLIVDDGSSTNKGNSFNYGTTGQPDRAIGHLCTTSGYGDAGLQVALFNNTGSPITSLTVQYTGEQWRDWQGSSSSGPEKLRVYVSPSNNAGYIHLGAALEFTAPQDNGISSALDGNLAANRTVLSSTINLASIGYPGGAIAPQQIFYITWDDWNDNATNDHALAVDDVSITAIPEPATMSLLGLGALALIRRRRKA